VKLGFWDVMRDVHKSPFPITTTIYLYYYYFFYFYIRKNKRKDRKKCVVQDFKNDLQAQKQNVTRKEEDEFHEICL